MSSNTRHNSERGISYCTMKNGQNDCEDYENKIQMPNDSIQVTPNMLRDAVQELEMIRAYVGTDIIINHLQRRYPVQRNYRMLQMEVTRKLHCAVCVGLLEKCEGDKYCIPTLRKDTVTDAGTITAFWELYYADKRKEVDKR